MSTVDPERLRRAYETARDALLAERHPEGYWTGELSTSALSTATAVSALALVQRHGQPDKKLHHLVEGGITWLVQHQNADGGWGDTVKSLSNISTTMLCRAAFHLSGTAEQHGDCAKRTQAYVSKTCGATPAEQAEAVRRRYGKDRTFAVPILTTCALAGLVSWHEVPSLPFELACLPQSWFRFLRLPVVSYALPALIAIGQCVYYHRPPRNPISYLARRLALKKSLRVLQSIQPSSGGFLEAIPLTSFVTLSLASIGHADHPVAVKGTEFLINAVRPDGSWAIDSNLATWVTTLAVNALAAAGELGTLDELDNIFEWLERQQFKDRHLYTGAAPGGWGWTDLPGSVPDADDTAGALLAFSHLRATGEGETGALLGLRWLCRLENSDGGWPTFCRGWGHLAFDRSGSDLTGHTLRACAAWWRVWMDARPIPTELHIRYRLAGLDRRQRQIFWPLVWAIPHGLDYVSRSQRPDGSWLPLWFGNQYAPDDENPSYGTARVLAAYRDLDMMDSEPARRGVEWLLRAQNSDGGWGGAPGVPPTIEETALAVEVLLDAGARAAAAVNRGLAWLVQQVEAGGLYDPSPIGFYFAKLWYFEKLYPIIFTVAALGRACRRFAPTATTRP